MPLLFLHQPSFKLFGFKQYVMLGMHSPGLINWVEKRIKRRHRAPGLRCKLSFTGLTSWLKPTLNVHCVDINRYGMAGVLSIPVKEGAIVSLSFRGKYIVQSNVKATVSSCAPSPQGYRVSLIFCYATDSKHYNRRVDNALSRIERIYSKQ